MRTPQILVFFLSLSLLKTLSAETIVSIEQDIFTSQDARYESFEIIESFESGYVIQYKDADGNILYGIIASILTVYLPESLRALCTEWGYNKDQCETVYQLAKALVILKGSGIRQGIVNTYRWVVNGGGVRSYAKIETSSYKAVKIFKLILDAYRDKCSQGNGLPWENIQETEIHSSENSRYGTDEDLSNTVIGDYSVHSVYNYREGETYYYPFKGISGAVNISKVDNTRALINFSYTEQKKDWLGKLYEDTTTDKFDIRLALNGSDIVFKQIWQDNRNLYQKIWGVESTIVDGTLNSQTGEITLYERAKESNELVYRIHLKPIY